MLINYEDPFQLARNLSLSLLAEMSSTEYTLYAYFVTIYTYEN